MTNDANGECRKSGTGPLVRKIFGYLIGLVCLVWVFHDVHLGRMFNQVNRIIWPFIIAGVFFDVASYASQGWRWSILLRPLGKITPLKTTQAIYAGLFTNEILPLRIGEFVRSYLVSRWLNKEFMSVLPSIAVERMQDGIWLALGIGLVALLIQLPRRLTEAADILGIIVIIGIAIFAWLVVRSKRGVAKGAVEPTSGPKLIRAIKSFLYRLAEGITEIGSTRIFYLSLLVSSLVLIFQILAFWLVMKGCDLNLSLWKGAAVMMIVHLGTTIPSAPSNLGTYQFFCVVGLMIFGIDKTLATAFSMIVFIVLTIPLWAIGLVAINQTGMKLKDIRAEISRKFSSRLSAT